MKECRAILSRISSISTQFDCDRKQLVQYCYKNSNSDAPRKPGLKPGEFCRVG